MVGYLLRNILVYVCTLAFELQGSLLIFNFCFSFRKTPYSVFKLQIALHLLNTGRFEVLIAIPRPVIHGQVAQAAAGIQGDGEQPAPEGQVNCYALRALQRVGDAVRKTSNVSFFGFFFSSFT